LRVACDLPITQAPADGCAVLLCCVQMAHDVRSVSGRVPLHAMAIRRIRQQWRAVAVFLQ
jgi:hypothetical protein